MNITREKRKQLDALSKEVFGVSSRWQKLLKEGNIQLVTKKTTEIVPGKDGAPDTTKEVDVPVLTEYGAKQFGVKQYNLAEVEELLVSYKKQVDDIKEQLKKQQEEKAQKEAAETALKQVKEAAEGSAAI